MFIGGDPFIRFGRREDKIQQGIDEMKAALGDSFDSGTASKCVDAVKDKASNPDTLARSEFQKMALDIESCKQAFGEGLANIGRFWIGYDKTPAKVEGAEAVDENTLYNFAIEDVIVPEEYVVGEVAGFDGTSVVTLSREDSVAAREKIKGEMKKIVKACYDKEYKLMANLLNDKDFNGILFEESLGLSPSAMAGVFTKLFDLYLTLPSTEQTLQDQIKNLIFALADHVSKNQYVMIKDADYKPVYYRGSSNVFASLLMSMGVSFNKVGVITDAASREAWKLTYDATNDDDKKDIERVGSAYNGTRAEAIELSGHIVTFANILNDRLDDVFTLIENWTQYMINKADEKASSVAFRFKTCKEGEQNCKEDDPRGLKLNDIWSWYDSIVNLK